MTKPIRAGLALTGSFCTFARVLRVLETLLQKGYEVTPILSYNAGSLDTRFGTAAEWREKLEALTGRPVIDSLVAAEPIGPKALFDVLAVAPCTGNTLAKLAHGVTDTPVTMAVKSHLRGEKPVVLAVSTNDALSGSAANIGALLSRRHYYFVPMRQDAPLAKPRSLVAQMELLPDTIEAALAGSQLQPILLEPGQG
ncbi:dipicolinate synthase subunit B [Agathobaculum sp.]|uniref:dipicolinate synthase subunit B n=1 Tax=Agathobaculum sp. TaxID=2048138 RepID=UPI002A8079E2|nr:dipicolinate synthase subunit B [Agathobaculum sp.]MDY3618342.1 dipicolinate synthase subunit B [Agathobaculum sp.]